MKLIDIIKHIEDFAPLALQESWDNSGLILGDRDQEVKSIMVCLDVTETVLNEAIEKGCNLILSHHPIIFKGIKKLTENNSDQRILRKAIKNDIAIYAAHTSLDNAKEGINSFLAKKLGLKNISILAPKEDCLFKIVTYVPNSHADIVRDAMFKAGAGSIGNYNACSYNLEGTGTFKAQEDTNPFVGNIGEMHFENEVRIETITPKHLLSNVIRELIASHPYEEPAYDVFQTHIQWNQAGLGVVGELENAVEEEEFFQHLKTTFHLSAFRRSPRLGKKVKKIAICSGSGADFITRAKAAHADAYLSGDISYHRFFEHDDKMLIIDIGHAETELPTKELFCYELSKRINGIQVIASANEVPPMQFESYTEQ